MHIRPTFHTVNLNHLNVGASNIQKICLFSTKEVAQLSVKNLFHFYSLIYDKNDMLLETVDNLLTRCVAVSFPKIAKFFITF